MATLAPHASEVNAGAAVTLSSDELRTLSLRCDRPGLLRLLVHLGLLAISGSAIMLVEHAALRLPGMVVHGIVLSFLFAPLHESVHRTAFRSRFLNQLAGCIGGAVLVLPPEYFRHFHMAHHRYTQDSERDPELLTAKPTSLAGYLLVLSGFEYWYRTCSGLLRRAAGRVPTDLIPPAQRRRIVIEARCFCAGYAGLAAVSLVFGWDWVLWLWICPALLGQPFLRAYLLAEHWGCPAVPDMWRNTRSTVSNRLVRFLAWNMPYHAEHHAHASVPFHALPALSRRMAAARRVVAPGYRFFHRHEVPDLIRRRVGL